MECAAGSLIIGIVWHRPAKVSRGGDAAAAAAAAPTSWDVVATPVSILIRHPSRDSLLPLGFFWMGLIR